jgi:Xaa-Pro aminopeptidase
MQTLHRLRLAAIAGLVLSATSLASTAPRPRSSSSPPVRSGGTPRLFGQTFAEFAARREAVRKAAGNAIVLLGGAVKGFDVERDRYRTHNDLMYLTGIEAPGAWLALLPAGDPSGKREILFLPSQNPDGVKWEDDVTSPTSAPDALGGIESVQNAASMWSVLTPSIEHASAVYVEGPVGERAKYDPAGAIEDRLRSIRPDLVIQASAAALIHPLRRIKSPDEIANLRKAIDITGEAEFAAARTIRDGVSELAVEGAILHAFRAGGAVREGFLSVVGSGPNSCVLHHFSGPRRMKRGEVVVCDIGAEWNYYSADITRTFPCGGRFSPRQRALYQLVLDVQRACEKAVTPGKTTLQDLNNVARRALRESPLRAVDASGSERTMDGFLPHSIGHYIGLDVHDVGGWPAVLDVGTVFTIEPGVYIAREGIGIRIEDDYLVTEHGVEKLSRAIPSEAREVEAMMRGWRPRSKGRTE